MSEAVSALPGTRAEGLVRIEEAGVQGMITLRGDLSDARLAAALCDLAGLEIPGPRGIFTKDAHALAWMSPDELLLMLPYAQAREAAAILRNAMAGQHFLAENVSDARAMFRLTGPDAALREVVAKLAPLDMAPDAFVPGTIRRSKLGQVAAAVWMPGPGALSVVCFRSVAGYAFDLLANAAQKGSAVGYFRG